MKNIIVVTGGAGFVGSNLIKFLIKNTNKNMISLDNYSSGSRSNHLKNKRVKYLTGNTIEFDKKISKYKKKFIQFFILESFQEFIKVL